MANPPGVDAEEVARKLAAMSLGRVRAREARLAAEAQLLSEVTALDLEGLRRRASMRQWLCAVGEASGATEPELARLLGLKGGAVSVHRLRKHPVVRRLVELIQHHQLQLVLRGEFGAQSQAKAAGARFRLLSSDAVEPRNSVRHKAFPRASALYTLRQVSGI
jgi:hypothetical protein